MMPLRHTSVALLTVAVAALPLRAQDTVPPVEQGVRIGITYTPGVRPAILVLGGPRSAALDSARLIMRRDLDFSDQFEIISLPTGDSLILGISGNAGERDSRGEYVNYPLYAALGADFAVSVLSDRDPSVLAVTVYDVRGGSERRRLQIPAATQPDPAFRMAVHHAADEVLRATSGEAGVAASRVVFIQQGRLYRVDSDGAALATVSPAGVTAFSPTWYPGGGRVVYTELSDGRGRVVIHDLAGGARTPVQPTASLLNFSSSVSPDAQWIAFARSGDDGSHVYRYNLARDCCLERLTVGRFSDNLSPTFSPDGRQIAFVSTRAGLPQVYVMAADGTGQELFAPFDFGVTGSSFAPEWSPDGTKLAFHRDVAGSPQVFVMDTRSRVVRQLTSAGRNEDPTWAPDSRHLAFISDRTGRRQVWVIDVETGRVRQLTTVGDARLPAWSPRLLEPTKP